MPSALSYLTLNGSEVTNSARLKAFFDAGLLPPQIEVQNPACGALVRAAALATGVVCSDFGFWDTFAETTDLSIVSTPSYFGTTNTPGTISPVVQPSGTGSDGSVQQGVSSFSVNEAFSPAQGSSWRDGVVVVALDQRPLVAGDNPKVTAYGRIGNDVQNVTPSHASVGDSYVGARLTFTTSGSAIELRGFSRAVASGTSVLFASTSIATLPTGRLWVVLRMAANVLTAELWSQDPRMGGQALYTTTPYTLTTNQYLGTGLTEQQALGVAGRQGFGLENAPAATNIPTVTSPEWWSAPACVNTAHLYPSTFLYPSSTLYPDESGSSETILATTPWTDSSRPESAEFFGFYMDTIDGLDGQATRSVDQRVGGLGGAALGALVQGGRVLKVHGWLIAGSCRGQDYGREWLTDLLSQTCSPCPVATLTVRTAQPSPDDGTNDNEGLYQMYGAGLTDGPTITSPTPECVLAEVTFTITVGNGYKYKPRTSIYGPVTLASVNGQALVTLPPPSGIGTNGAIIVLKAGSSDLTGVFPAELLATYPAINQYPSACLYPNNGGAPVTLPNTSCPAGFNIPIIPAGYTLTIDGARHTITLTDPNGVQSDGTYLLSQSTASAISWPEADACDTAGYGVAIGATGYASDATVQVYAKQRER